MSKIDLTITETYLIKIAAYQISKNQLFISEKELVNLINNKDQFEFLLKVYLFCIRIILILLLFSFSFAKNNT